MLARWRFSRLGFHTCRGDLILEKNEHSFVARKPGVYLFEQIIYAPSTDIDLAAVFALRRGSGAAPSWHGLSAQSALRPSSWLRGLAEVLNILLSRTGCSI